MGQFIRSKIFQARGNMTQEDFFNVSAINTSQEKEGEVISFPSPSDKVTKRVFHTRTEFTIYPNGKIFPSKTAGWFEDKIYAHNPKKKEEIKPAETQIKDGGDLF